MQQEQMLPFLVRAAIPKAGARNSQTEQDDVVWDAIWRAHRDTTTRPHLVQSYSNHKIDDEAKSTHSNAIPEKLYSVVTHVEDSQKLASTHLIHELSQAFPDVNLGPLQKLVNMSLKYLFILQTLQAQDAVLGHLPQIKLEHCDCPLDAQILTHVKGYKDVRWTRMDSLEEYEAIQTAIGDVVGQDKKLLFDLDNWQDLELGL